MCRIQICRTEVAFLVWEIYERSVFVTDQMMKMKARQLQFRKIEEDENNNHAILKFSNGWFWKFKNKNRFRCHKSHAEYGDVAIESYEEEMNKIKQKLKDFALNDAWNHDQLGVFYNRAPTSTIEPARLEGRKKREERATFLGSCNADETANFPLRVSLGSPLNPIIFFEDAEDVY